MPKIPSSLFLHYGNAVVVPLLATLLRLAFDPILGNHVVIPPYYGAVMLIAWYAGSGPAVVTLLISTLLADYLFIPPRGTLEVWDVAHEAEYSLYISVGLFIILLIRQFQSTRTSEAQVRHQASELEAIYQNAPVGLCVLDRELRFVRINARLAEINGLPAAAHLGKTVRELLPQLADEAEPLLRRVIATGRPALNHELSGETPAQPGVRRQWIEHWLPLKDKDGAVVGINVVTEEITARKAAEVALRASEARFRALFEQAGVGIAELDPETGTLLRVNQKLAAIGEYAPHELLGEAFLQFIHPDDRPVAAAHFQDLVKGETGEADLELRGLRKDATVAWIQVTAAMVRLAEGQSGRAVAVVQDITARKRVEVELKRSEERYRIVAEYNLDWEYWLGPDGALRYISPSCETVSGYRPEAFIADPTLFRRLVHPDDAPTLEQHRRHIQAVRDTASLDFRLVRPDGAVRWVHHVCRPVFGADGEYLGRRASNRDITERKCAEAERERLLAQLAEADRRKDEFLAVLAHELRNPLAPIANAFALIQRAAGAPALVEQALGIGKRQVEQLARLVDDLLDISRISRGKITLRKAHIPLQAILQTAFETSRPQIEAGGHRLAVELPEAPVYLEADLTRLAQAVSNLLINAAKYTEPGGQIQLRAYCEGEAVVIAVQDTGIGIPAEQLPRVFELFMQADQARHHIWRGLGVGLPLAKSLVELHGGSIAAASPGSGQGSTFTLRLPMAAGRAASEPACKEKGTEAPAPIRRILVVDDQADVADSMAMLLKTYGHAVQVAYNGTAALEMARAHRPEVVLLDLGMPGMDGYEVARQLRQLPELHGTRLIALTGWGQEQDKQRTREAGFDAHLVKPVELSALRTLLGGESSAAPTRQSTEAN